MSFRRRAERVPPWAAGLLACAVLTAACASERPPDRPDANGPRSAVSTAASAPARSPSGSPISPPASSPARSAVPAPSVPATRPGQIPPPWLGKRPLPVDEHGFGQVRRTPRRLARRAFTLPDTVVMLPGTGFASRVVTPAPERVLARSTWRTGCPVAASDLSWLRLTFHGFDGRRHTGELLVNRTATADLVAVFRQLYAARFPIEEMRITTRAERDAPPTGDGNDTGSFVCRPVVGQTSFSQHAYGLAVDLDPFQNPYVKGDLVLPELASAYLDRDWRRPGMIEPDGLVVRAFASVGWGWGGSWRSLKDLQHFSANGT